MSETLLSSSLLLLYGREMTDITLAPGAYAPAVPPGSTNKLVESNLTATDATLARIYAFSFEGQFYELAAPAIFVVHGKGEDPQPSPVGNVAVGPGRIDEIGVAYQYGSFAPDTKVWAYDKTDYSVRLDIASGPLDEILLGAELLDDDGDFHFGGGKVGGGKVGGGKVGGGKVGGGKVGGGKVGGGKVGGGKVGGGKVGGGKIGGG
jgi:hypothetical protein